MKNVLKLSGLVIGIALVVTSCFLFTVPVSPTERITNFQANLNSNSRSTTYEHIHSGVSVYNQIKPSSWWESSSFATANQTFGFNISFISEAAGVKVYTGVMVGGVLNGQSVTVKFKEELPLDGAWYIYSIILNNSTIF